MFNLRTVVLRTSYIFRFLLIAVLREKRIKEISPLAEKLYLFFWTKIIIIF